MANDEAMDFYQWYNESKEQQVGFDLCRDLR